MRLCNKLKGKVTEITSKVTRYDVIDALRILGTETNYNALLIFCGAKPFELASNIIHGYENIKIGDYVIKDSNGNCEHIDLFEFYRNFEQGLYKKGWRE